MSAGWGLVMMKADCCKDFTCFWFWGEACAASVCARGLCAVDEQYRIPDKEPQMLFSVQKGTLGELCRKKTLCIFATPDGAKHIRNKNRRRNPSLFSDDQCSRQHQIPFWYQDRSNFGCIFWMNLGIVWSQGVQKMMWCQIHVGPWLKLMYINAWINAFMYTYMKRCCHTCIHKFIIRMYTILDLAVRSRVEMLI